MHGKRPSSSRQNIASQVSVAGYCTYTLRGWRRTTTPQVLSPPLDLVRRSTLRPMISQSWLMVKGHRVLCELRESLLALKVWFAK